MSPLDEVAQLLCYTRSAGVQLDAHTSGCVTCPDCRGRYLAALAVLDDPGRTADDQLATVARLLADPPIGDGDRHPFGSCVTCDGCSFEMGEAAHVAALGAAGVSTVLHWGPPHRPADLVDHRDDCDDCARWRHERADAAVRLRDAGFDPDAVLGDETRILAVTFGRDASDT